MLINRFKAVALFSVLGFQMSGCVAADVKTTPTVPVLPNLPTNASADTTAPAAANGGQKTRAPNFTKDRGVGFKVNEQGAMIPIAADGTPFASCGTLDNNSCSLFKNGITINKMERINITKIEHQINPTCLLYIINYRGVDYVWYDKTDPNCAKFN